MRNILSISPRRSTIDIPLPTEEVEVNGFPPSNKTERLKKSAIRIFGGRDRVKVLFPNQYKNRTGYVLEDEFASNNGGFLQVELDHILTDSDGYKTLIDSTIKREIITIKNPSKQLIPYKYMKCQQQHFRTDITAESVLRINNIITFILGPAIICLLFGIDASKWNISALFYLFCLSQSVCIGIGFYCILILSFIGISIKRMSGYNNLIQLGAVHDECTSYYWLKSQQYEPWWICKTPQSLIPYILKQSGKAIIIFIITFKISIILFIADQMQIWYLIIICCIIFIVPLLFAVDIIRNSIPDTTQYQQQHQHQQQRQQQHQQTHTNTANHINYANDPNNNNNKPTKFSFNETNPNNSISMISYSNNTTIDNSTKNNNDNNNTKKKGKNPFDF